PLDEGRWTASKGVPQGVPFAAGAARYKELRSERQATERAGIHHFPVFGIDFHGSAGGKGSPFCSSSTDWRSGERTKAMTPSRGGRLMVTPAFISCSHVS